MIRMGWATKCEHWNVPHPLWIVGRGPCKPPDFATDHAGVAGYGARQDVVVILTTQRVLLIKFYLTKRWILVKYDTYLELGII